MGLGPQHGTAPVKLNVASWCWYKLSCKKATPAKLASRNNRRALRPFRKRTEATTLYKLPYVSITCSHAEAVSQVPTPQALDASMPTLDEQTSLTSDCEMEDCAFPCIFQCLLFRVSPRHTQKSLGAKKTAGFAVAF